MATLPRCVEAGKTYMVSRRTSERRFFLKPSDNVNHTSSNTHSHGLLRRGEWLLRLRYAHLKQSEISRMGASK